MTNIEKVKHIRALTASPIDDINIALKTSNGDERLAIKLLVAQKQADNNDMNNRIANNGIVYSYVHTNKVGAMIVLSCQTDFAAKNDLFVNLAKDICMHIVSTPIEPQWIDENDIPTDTIVAMSAEMESTIKGKPPEIIAKIVTGKMKKYYTETCLYRQSFIKDDTMTIQQLIQSVSNTIGEKIAVKKFVKMSNSFGFVHEGPNK
jgi:elongation factor Ts